MKNKKPIQIVVIFCIITTLIVLFRNPIIAFANDLYTFTIDEQIGLFYDINQPWLVSNNFITDALHTIGWEIIKFLKYLVDASEILYKKSIGLLDFTNYDGINNLVDEFKLAYAGIMTLSVLYLGYSMIISHERKINIFKSLILSVFCFGALAGIMIELNSTIQTFAVDTVGNGNSSSKIIYQQTYDLLKGIKNKEDEFSIEDKNHLKKCRIKANAISLIDINEVMNYSSKQLSEKASSLLSAKLSRVWSTSESDFNDQIDSLIAQAQEESYNNAWAAANSSYNDNSQELIEYLNQLKELPSGSTVYMLTPIDSGYKLPFESKEEKNGFMNEFYYRYHVEFFPIIITLIAYIIVYISMSYKAIRCIYELAIKKILAILYSADINGTQKTMKILSSIRDGYIIIMLSSILIKVFTLMNTYLNDNLSIQNVNVKALVKCIFLIMIALAVVDGPDIIQQLTGIDAGLSGGVGKLMAAYHIGKGVTNTATAAPRGLAKLAGNKLRDHQLANSIEKAHESKRAIDNASVQDVENRISNNPDNKTVLDDKNMQNGPEQANISDDEQQNLDLTNEDRAVDDWSQSKDYQNPKLNDLNSENMDNDSTNVNDLNSSIASNSDDLDVNTTDNDNANVDDLNAYTTDSNGVNVNGLNSNIEDSVSKKEIGNDFNQLKNDVSKVNMNQQLENKNADIQGQISNLNKNTTPKDLNITSTRNVGINQQKNNMNELNDISSNTKSSHIDPSEGTYNLNGKIYKRESSANSQKIEEGLRRDDNLLKKH